MVWMPKKLRRLLGTIHETNQHAKATLEIARGLQSLHGSGQGASAHPAAGQLIELEYPVVPRERALRRSAGGRALSAMLDASRPRYEATLENFATLRDRLKAIEIESEDARQPSWKNSMLPVIDSALLYTYVASRKPATYFEIGSGNSTKLVRRAISDHGLATRIVSVDPAPRAEIDSLCDETIRAPFEDVADRLPDRIRSGDVVYFDGSHRSFQNSDVTVFFTEFVPALPAGTLYGIHDIFLPDDYPAPWFDRFYSEQYVLMAYLLGGAGGDTIEFPGLVVSQDPASRTKIDRLFDWITDDGIKHGSSFWMTSAGREPGMAGT